MTKAHNNLLICALIATGFALLVAWYLSASVQFNVVNLTLRVQTIEAVTAVVKEIDHSGGETELARMSFEGNQGVEPQNITSAPINRPIRRLKVELLPDNPEQGTAVILHEVFLYPSYSSASEVYLYSSLINDTFDVSAPAKSENNYYELAAGEVLSFASQERVVPANWFFVGLVTAFIFVIAFCLARLLHWRQLPAIQDMSLGQQISSAHEFNTINGLRGLAALLVLLSHSAPGWNNLQVGIGILFVISGFLLSKPFVLDNRKIFSIKNIETFWHKRIKRILPMYFVFVFLSYGLSAEFDSLWRHFLFVQAGGHLWPMTQIFVFYMLLPLILLLTSVAGQVHRWLPLLLLALAIVLWVEFLPDWEPFYNGFYFHEFYLYAFLMGVLASYLQYGFLQSLLQNWLERSAFVEVMGVVALVFTMALIFYSAPLQAPAALAPFFSQFFFKCLGCLLLILVAVNTPRSWFNRLLSNPIFQSIGIVGFSFYLLHGFGIDLFASFGEQLMGLELGERDWRLTVGAFLITYPLALLTYSYIERPFFGARHNSSTKNGQQNSQ